MVYSKLKPVCFASSWKWNPLCFPSVVFSQRRQAGHKMLWCWWGQLSALKIILFRALFNCIHKPSSLKALQNLRTRSLDPWLAQLHDGDPIRLNRCPLLVNLVIHIGWKPTDTGLWSRTSWWSDRDQTLEGVCLLNSCRCRWLPLSPLSLSLSRWNQAQEGPWSQQEQGSPETQTDLGVQNLAWKVQA